MREVSSKSVKYSVTISFVWIGSVGMRHIDACPYCVRQSKVVANWNSSIWMDLTNLIYGHNTNYSPNSTTMCHETISFWCCLELACPWEIGTVLAEWVGQGKVGWFTIKVLSCVHWVGHFSPSLHELRKVHGLKWPPKFNMHARNNFRSWKFHDTYSGIASGATTIKIETHDNMQQRFDRS